MARFQGVPIEVEKKPRFSGQKIKEEKYQGELPQVYIGQENVAPSKRDPGLGFGDYAEGALDVMLTIPTAISGSMAGASDAILQIAKEMISGQYGSPEAAQRVLDQFQATTSYYTRPPQTEGGKFLMGKIGEVAEQIPVMPQMQAFAPNIKIAAQQLSIKAAQIRPILNSKLGRSASLIDDNNLPSKPLQNSLKKYGVDYSLIIDDPETLPMISGRTSPDDVVKQIIKKKLITGSDNKSLYNKMLSNGSIVYDALGDEAVKQGFRPGDVSSAKNANIQTKKIMSRMLDQKRLIEGSSEQALKLRPSDYIGDEVMKRVDLLKNKSLELRKDLDSISNKLKGVPIDTTTVQTRVFDGLERIGINIPDEAYRDPRLLKGLLKNKSFFEGSDISKDSMSQKVIRDVVDLLSEDVGSDALRAHKLKRQIDTMIDYKQKTYGGLTDTGKNFAKSIRRSLNDSVREVSKEYAKTNDELTNIFSSLDEVRDILPKKIDLDSELASSAMGQELRKLLSNYSKRNEIRSALKNVDDVASNYSDYLDVSIDRLVQFNNTLDTRFRPTARGSFKSEIADAFGQELSATAMAKQKALGLVVESIEKFRNINDEEAFNTMKKLLERQ